MVIVTIFEEDNLLTEKYENKTLVITLFHTLMEKFI